MRPGCGFDHWGIGGLGKEEFSRPECEEEGGQDREPILYEGDVWFFWAVCKLETASMCRIVQKELHWVRSGACLPPHFPAHVAELVDAPDSGSGG